MRWIFAMVGLSGLAALGLLTVVPVPTWLPWQLGVLAGEFGHWGALAAAVAAGTVGVAWATGWVRRRGAAGVTLGLAVGAMALLAWPSVAAWRLAQPLPERMRAAFGPEAAGQRPVWSWGALFGGGVRVEERPVRTFVFAHGGTAEELELDFYPARGAGPRPAVVMIHGGGWDGGSRDQLVTFNQWLADEGYAVAAISYRLAPRQVWPAQREDVVAALAWLKAEAGALGVDATRLVVFGRSAGGQLATAVGYAVRDPAVRGVVAFYAPHDMPFAWRHSREDDALNSIKLMRQFLGGSPEEVPGRYASASGQAHVERGVTPPTLLLHGANDTLVWRRHSERLAGALGEAGVPHVWLELPWATHGLEFNLNGPGGQLARAAVSRFLAAVVGPPAAAGDGGAEGVSGPVP